MSSELALSLRNLELRRFRNRGVAIAVTSGIAYGLYSAFVTLAMSRGVWAGWYAPETGLSTFAVIYLLGIIGAGLNDLFSGVWAAGIAAFRGKLGDVLRCLFSKPGAVLMACALIGGPIGSVAYIIALQVGGSVVIPVTALCPAIGAILGRVLFRQELNARMLLGVGLCITASIAIGWSSLRDGAGEGAVLGIVLALVAAFAWAIEGVVAGLGTSVVDYEIGITIRQWTSGLVTLLVLLPLVGTIGASLSESWHLVSQASSDSPSLPFFAISGFCALFAFGLWYKGNGMCGAALGMASNGTYAFWGPLFCWLLLGVIFREPGWGLEPIAWVAAVVMSIGIFVIAVNPLALLRGDSSAHEGTSA